MKLNRIIVVRTIVILLIFTLFSCDPISNNFDNELKGPGAIVLTFDDKYISDWFTADSIFSIYDWKATFCVTKYETLTDNEKQKLKKLQNKGHEIASHGNQHIRATEYLANHTMDDYTNEEISPSLKSMESDGLNISSFSYPYGFRSIETDLTLFNYFSILRGTTWKYSTMSSQKCFVNKGSEKMIVYSLGIDNHYEYFNIDFYLNLLKYAHQEGLALILYGHKIADDDTSKYVTSYNTLNEICNYAQQNGMEFLTLRELVNFNLN